MQRTILTLGPLALGSALRPAAVALACLLAGAPLAAGPGLAGASQGEDQVEVPDKRPEVQALVDELAELAAQRGEKDTEAIGAIDKLLGEFPKSGPKDRALIVKELDGCIKERRKADEEGLPDNRLHMAAATALGRMGPESVKPLIEWIGHKQHEDDLALQRQLILSLGSTKDERGVSPLVKLLDHHLPQIQAATAEALASYSEQPQEVRKDIFKELLATMMRVRAIIDQDQNETIEHERWEIISGPIMSSLQRLSGHEEHDAHEWQHWWNKNKKEDWEGGEPG